MCYNSAMEVAKPETRASGSPAPPAGLWVVLPLPPGVNNLYVSVNGRRALSREGRRFKAEVHARLDDMRAEGRLPPETLEAIRSGYLSLFIDFYFPTPLKRDLDGGLKITQDALCEALGINDNRVVDIHIVKRIDPSRPRIQVQLETIKEADWHFDEEFVYIGAAGK
jgi:crossover junction endodeoxyribonuclease RusA